MFKDVKYFAWYNDSCLKRWSKKSNRQLQREIFSIYLLTTLLNQLTTTFLQKQQ